MHSIVPSVEGGRLYQSGREDNPIIVGTLEWYTWLEHHTFFIFADRTGSFTARKSDTDPSHAYWEASRTRQGKHYSAFLGLSHTLTLSRLQTAAQTLASEQTAVPQVTAVASLSPVAELAASVDHLSPLVRTKLYRPRTSTDVITRSRLLDRLNGGLSCAVTLVSAPAGFGKTTLLAQWVQTIERSVAWLSLDEHDNEPRVFMQSLTAALQSVFPGTFGATVSLLEAPRFPSIDYVVTLFINDLADVPDDFMLVLDDYHLMHTREIHSFLEQLIEHLPPHLHVVLISRSDPPLPLARWRARGYINDLRPTDLRFTLEETEAFLTRELGSVAAHESAAALEERIEGWIAILRLAALSLRNTSDRVAFIERLRSRPDRSIGSYLVQEILAHLAPAEQKMLEHTSILEQFCAELCVAVMGNEDPREHVEATLNWLVHANLFLVPLDERQGWYRFHHLFQQLLQQRLQVHSSVKEIATLHQRASAWYAEQGLIEQAIEHALIAGDVSGATRLVEAQFFWAFEQEQLVQMEHWLGLLPEEQIQGSPFLLIARMWIFQARGQMKDLPRLLGAAEQLLETIDLDERKHRLLRALIAIFWSQFQYLTGQIQASLESAMSALVMLPPDEEYIASFALAWLAWSNQAFGNEEVALLELNKALKERSTHFNSTARLLYAQCIVYHAAGKLPQLEHTARHLLQISRDTNLTLSQYWAHWLLGAVYYEWNKLDAAVYHFSAVIANKHQAHLWAVQDALCGLALVYQAQGLGTQAQETARTLLEWVQEQNKIPQLMISYAFCGHLALLQNEVEQASQWLEMAGKQEVQGPMLYFEDPPITTARLLLAKGDEVSVSHAQSLLNHLLRHAESIHSTRKTIGVLAMRAWACDLQGREIEALAVLERALALARPGGFMRTFADLPALVRLLHELRKRRRAYQEADRTLETYLQHLLAAMVPVSTAPVSMEDLLRQEGLEPLTDRELHILHLLDRDLTNKEIARELVVTTGTVKVHTSNVYRKLSVNNRRAAVTLAKSLGFLAAS